MVKEREKSAIEDLVLKMGAEAFLATMTPEQQEMLPFQWPLMARPSQLSPPGEWLTWLILAGRGFGKTRSGAEFVRQEIEAKRAGRVAIIAPTAADCRDVAVEGESGLLAISPKWNRPDYEPSKRRVTWPNGAQASLYSADEPDRLRGPQHDLFWCEELAAYNYPQLVWDNLMFGLRLGRQPRGVVTTTPRPTPLIRELVNSKTTAVTRGSTFDNEKNLPASALKTLRDKYEGTRIGRQELNGEILDDTPGALWNREMLEKTRVQRVPNNLRRTIVAVDPAGSAKKTADEAGIIVVGAGPCFCNGREEDHCFVLEDVSGKYQPKEMAEKAVASYYRFKCDRLVAEDNFGGQMIKDLITLTDDRVGYKSVHASRGKIVRAEPVSALSEQGKIHLVGIFPELEDELCQYSNAPAEGERLASPGRLDAFVWAVTELALGDYTEIPEITVIRRWKNQSARRGGMF